MKTGQVYILLCSDSSYYTGITSNLDLRLAQHNEGSIPGYTHSRRPVKLVWSSQILPIQDAILLEKQIKNWSRKKKQAMIENKWNDLHVLARCRNKSHFENVSLDSARDDGHEATTKYSMPLNSSSGSHKRLIL